MCKTLYLNRFANVPGCLVSLFMSSLRENVPLPLLPKSLSLCLSVSLSLCLSLSLSLSLSLIMKSYLTCYLVCNSLSLICLQTISSCMKYYYSKSKSSPIKSFLLAKSRKMDCKDKPRTWQCTYFISQIHTRILRKGLLQSQTIKI